MTNTRANRIRRAAAPHVHNRAKLSIEQVRWVRANLGVPVKVAAARLGVHRGTIQAIRSGKSWNEID